MHYFLCYSSWKIISMNDRRKLFKRMHQYICSLNIVSTWILIWNLHCIMIDLCNLWWNWAFGQNGRVLANGPRDWGSIPGWVKKWYLMPPCLTLRIIRYGPRVKWINPEKGIAPSLIAQCSCYWKGSLRVNNNYVNCIDKEGGYNKHFLFRINDFFLIISRWTYWYTYV